VSSLHSEKISSAIYFKCDSLGGKKLILTASEQPGPALKISEFDSHKKSLSILGQASAELSERLNGWQSLALNPLQDNLVAAASSQYHRDTDELKGGSI
jgi:hypothetical protein